MNQSRVITAERIQATSPFPLRSLGGKDGEPPKDDPTYARGYQQGLLEGQARGHEAGFAAGQAAADAAHSQVLQAVGNDLARHAGRVAQSFEASLARLEADLADEVVLLALRVARRVVATQVASDPGALARTIAPTLAEMAVDARTLAIRVNPSDRDVLATAFERLAHEHRIEFIDDAAIARGGCLIDSDRARVDARLETRWQRVEAALGQCMTLEDPPNEDAPET
ncbi:MAG: flagellar assembly protein FliH [Burkholderiaceae bacterium]